MTLEAHDWLLVVAAASIIGVFAVYAGSRFLYYSRRARSIQQEIDTLPPIDYGRVRPRNNAVRLATLPELKELEMRAAARQAAYDREEDAREEARRVGLAQDRAPGTPRDKCGPSNPEVEQGGAVHPTPSTNLVPFARGYAFTGFSKRVH